MSPENAIGVILFDSVAHIQFNLHTYDSLDMVLSAINHLPYSGGGTDTAEALQLLLSNSQNGALGLRTYSSKVAIIITDGQSNSKLARFNAAAAALHASNIFDVYAVGVDGSNLTELQEISSSPQFTFNGINLQQLQHRILPQLCIGKYIHMYIYVCTYTHKYLRKTYLHTRICTYVHTNTSTFILHVQM